MRTTKNVFKFDELNDETKQKAIETCASFNVENRDWWEDIMNELDGYLKIESFDLDRSNFCRLVFLKDEIDVAEKIFEEHGQHCETYKTAKKFKEEYYKPNAEVSDVTDEFKENLESDYLSMLRKEYEYLTSKEAIIETIEANEYEFDENGNLA